MEETKNLTNISKLTESITKFNKIVKEFVKVLCFYIFAINSKYYINYNYKNSFLQQTEETH